MHILGESVRGNEDVSENNMQKQPGTQKSLCSHNWTHTSSKTCLVPKEFQKLQLSKGLSHGNLLSAAPEGRTQTNGFKR